MQLEAIHKAGGLARSPAGDDAADYGNEGVFNGFDPAQEPDGEGGQRGMVPVVHEAGVQAAQRKIARLLGGEGPSGMRINRARRVLHEIGSCVTAAGKAILEPLLGHVGEVCSVSPDHFSSAGSAVQAPPPSTTHPAPCHC